MHYTFFLQKFEGAEPRKHTHPRLVLRVDFLSQKKGRENGERGMGGRKADKIWENG